MSVTFFIVIFLFVLLFVVFSVLLAFLVGFLVFAISPGIDRIYGFSWRKKMAETARTEAEYNLIFLLIDL